MKQNYEQKADRIREQFSQLKKRDPGRMKRRLALSWSNWGFGMEDLAVSAARLKKAGIGYIELHGNHYGADLGYEPKETAKVLRDSGLQVAGICGMFSVDNDLSSNRASQRQAALDYIRRELDFGESLKASYMLVVPGAVGRPVPYDATEFERSAETLRLAADWFIQHGIRAAVEPIRSDEVSLVHSIADAKRYIDAVDHAGVRHINGDVYHMQAEEDHIGEALVDAGSQLANLHVADSNRRALGQGSLDLDTVIRALYVIGFNSDGHFVTAEPLGPGGDPYRAMHGKPDSGSLDELVGQSARYFRAREEEVVSEG